jgi:hypothetical protein
VADGKKPIQRLVHEIEWQEQGSGRPTIGLGLASIFSGRLLCRAFPFVAPALGLAQAFTRRAAVQSLDKSALESRCCHWHLATSGYCNGRWGVAAQPRA